MGTFDQRTGHTRRLQIRFSDEDVARLATRATELGLPLTATVRSLTRTALAGERDLRVEELEAVCVAAVMAAEQAVQLLELMVPGGTRRSADLADRVRLSALDRVAQIRRELEEAQP